MNYRYDKYNNLLETNVYIKVDNHCDVVQVDGGETFENVHDYEEWILAGSGIGSKYDFCQSLFFDKQLFNDDYCVFQYKCLNGEIIEKTIEEMEEESRSV